ncbi:MAG: carboxypeptidase-like regulatory domain-containing protein [Bacteroidota bacterium]
MKEKKYLLVCILLLAGFSGAWGQGGKKTITGTVSDSLRNPLSGVSVQVKGTKVSTVTDAGGKFTIQSDPGGTLVFTHVSFFFPGDPDKRAIIC